jgi:hypothetical protein
VNNNKFQSTQQYHESMIITSFAKHVFFGQASKAENGDQGWTERAHFSTMPKNQTPSSSMRLALRSSAAGSQSAVHPLFFASYLAAFVSIIIRSE